MWQYKQQQPTLLDRYIIISAINLKKIEFKKAKCTAENVNLHIPLQQCTH